MNATLPLEAGTNVLGVLAWDVVRSAFPAHFQARIGAAVSDALRSTALTVDEVEVTLDLRGGWFADILLSGGGRLESVVTRLRPVPIRHSA